MNNYYSAVLFSATVLMSSLQVSLAQEKWTIGTQQQWINNTVRQQGVEIKNGQITPNAKTTIIKSQLKEFANKRNAATITINQSDEWANWQPAKSVGPQNLRGAPVALQVALEITGCLVFTKPQKILILNLLNSKASMNL